MIKGARIFLKFPLRALLAVFVLGFCCFFLNSQAHAAKFSGEYLLKVCGLDRNGKEIFKGGQIACQSYISGIIDYHNFLRSLDSAGEKTFCIPEGETLNEIQLRVLLYLLQHQKLHNSFVAAPGVELALMSAYPC